jgi:hypothetical protein
LGGANNPNGWGLVDANNPSFSCFVNPEPGCYSQVTKGDGTPFTGIRNNRGLVLEKQERLCGEKGTCDGNSNNKFDDGAGREVMTCGSEVNGAECNLGAIADSCEGKPSFSLVEGVGWCHGDMGCSTSQCSEVIRKDGFEFEVGNVIESDFMAILATTNFIDNEDDLRFPFACGCPEGDVGRDQDEDELTNIVCDNNFDGRFEGRCSLAGACLGDGVE